MKRTSVILDAADQADLEYLTTTRRVSDTEAIRLSIRLHRLMLAWAEDGGEIVLSADGKTDRQFIFL